MEKPVVNFVFAKTTGWNPVILAIFQIFEKTFFQKLPCKIAALKNSTNFFSE